MQSPRLKSLNISLALTAGAGLLFYAGLFAARPLLSAFIRRMPENSEYLARQFLDRGEFDRAIQACQREIASNRYNFHACYLLAESLHRAGRKDHALSLLFDLPERYRAVVARNVPSRGWDEAYLHLLLARVLWEAGQFEQSLDQLQVAFDCHDPRVDGQCVEFAASLGGSAGGAAAVWAWFARTIVDPKASLEQLLKQMDAVQAQAPPHSYDRLAQIALARGKPTVAQEADAREIQLHPRELPSLVAHAVFAEQPGWPKHGDLTTLYSFLEQTMAGRLMFERQTDAARCLADSSWAHLFRTTVTTGTVAVSRPTRGVCLIARGTSCDGVWPILSVRLNGKVVGERYVRSSTYRVYTLPVELAPGIRTVGIGLENDAANPLTQRDRNLEIREVCFY
jgi:tetratricopeptide (TPR) repeat protein